MLTFVQGNCQNYIKLLLFDQQENIFVCGTYAAAPKCWKFKRNDALNPQPDAINGDGISPSSYQGRVTGIFTSSYLFAGISSRRSRRSLIYKTEADLSRSVVLTSDSSFKVLQDADFVTSFRHLDNFVYFFFRETAVEARKVVYSRVARICQYDEGGDGRLKNRFTSFVKTRIMCSVPGNIPFDYNEIQAAVTYTSPVTKEVYFYGIFTTPQLGVLGSAVCSYSVKSLQELFDNSPYLKETDNKSFDGTSLWVKEFPVNLSVVPGRPKCNAQLDTKRYSWKITQFASDHPLLAVPLMPTSLFKDPKPLFTKAGTRFTQLVVDKVNVGNGRIIPVMFISTDNGTVFKVFNNISGDGNAIVVEQVRLLENPEPIYTMKLYKGAVCIGSDSGVTKLPVEHCSEFTSCRTCVSALDPYCGWSDNTCTTFDNKKGSGWLQDIVYGNFSRLCPREIPLCSLTSSLDQKGHVNSLICQGDGVPLPKVIRLEKDSKTLCAHSDCRRNSSLTSHQERLDINNFGLQHLGDYHCFVSNEVGSSSCVINLAGSLPVVAYSLVRMRDESLFLCNGSGLPIPRITIYKVTGNTTLVVLARQTTITDDEGQRSYYCVAHNYFGVSFSKAIDINDKPVRAEMELTNEDWSLELSKRPSERYKNLAGQVRTAVQEIYCKSPAFVSVKDISFRRGSVLCQMTINFAAEASETSHDLLKELQASVFSGQVGNLTVDASHILNMESVPKPTPATEGKDSNDKGLLAVAVMTAVLLSLIIGFMLGMKCYGQVVNRCTPSSRNSDSFDGPKDRTIKGVKYTKSPPRDENFKRNKNESQSKRNLVKKKGESIERKEDSDSNSSTAGKIADESGDENFIRKPYTPLSPSISGDP
ncbi:semaphorin-2A-like isoform X3 [Stylophora pistillata]|uniref:semaphorin-2A-like isoform X3 n=1 Tax=Stylophora pistillata TaxID=50429 RepID=UPI000C04C294|nr:semaphorin-2A-like isoform X3 [Stylophora pistillata]